jgi:solute carrier family 25 (mitochondrial carnitine/acylcarnitine transporter), member 20/29
LVRTISFSVYQQTKYRSSDFIGRVTGEEQPLIKVNTPGSTPDLSTISCFGFAGAMAGAASTVVACMYLCNEDEIITDLARPV